MKYFTKLKLSGYKSIKDVSFTLQPGVNIFIGPNGSGKSNLLEFVYALNDLLPSLDDVFSIEVESFLDDKKIEYKIRKELLDVKDVPGWKKLLKEGEQVFFNCSIQILLNNEKILDESFSEDTTNWQLLQRISAKNEFGEKLYVHDLFNYITFVEFRTGIDNEQFLLNPKEVKIEHREVFNVKKTNSLLSWYISESLADSLEVSQEFSKEKYLKIFKSKIADFLRLVKDYTPIQGIKHKQFLSVRNNGVDNILENIQFEFLVNGSWYNWTDLSDGTRRVFEIVYYVHNSPETALIEEPELGIHPHQLNKLCQFLKEQAESKQILISTHSPEVLDRLANKELTNINLVSMKKGATQVKKLTPKQREKAKYYLEEESFLSDYWKYSDLEK